eukprot:gene934-1016_t
MILCQSGADLYNPGTAMDFSRFSCTESSVDRDIMSEVFKVNKSVPSTAMSPADYSSSVTGGGVSVRDTKKRTYESAMLTNHGNDEGNAEDSLVAVRDPPPRLRELFCSPGKMEKRLNLLIIGHNPSEKSWQAGHYYANPSNQMWPLLARAGIIPAHYNASCDQQCPESCGLGFTDVLYGVCETDSSKISDDEVRSYKSSFYARLVSHCHRVAHNTRMTPEECCPRIIAFAGVRQWKALFPKSHWRAKNGLARDQVREKEELFGVRKVLPPDWPRELAGSTVFLLPSSSGAAPMTREQRQGPYMQLGTLVGGLLGPMSDNA